MINMVSTPEARSIRCAALNVNALIRTGRLILLLKTLNPQALKRLQVVLEKSSEKELFAYAGKNEH